MLHPTIPVPKKGSIVSAQNWDVIHETRFEDVEILSDFEIMRGAPDGFMIAWGRRIKKNRLAAMVYYYDLGIPDYPIGFGGASEENFGDAEYMQAIKDYGIDY